VNEISLYIQTKELLIIMILNDGKVNLIIYEILWEYQFFHPNIG